MTCFHPRAALALATLSGLAANAAALEILPDAGAAVNFDGNGLNARFVETDPNVFIPHSITDALKVLNEGTGVIREVDLVAPYVDFQDTLTGYGGVTPGGLTDPLSLLGSDHYAVSYKGFLNVKQAGDYVFSFYGDDGFRLTIGGVTVSEFPTDTGAITTASGPVGLHAGLYSFDLLSWEQGGAFVNELSWLTPGASSLTIPGAGDGALVFFTSAPATVPAPAALPLLVGGLAGLAGLRRRR